MFKLSDDAYAVEILCNINQVSILNLNDYQECIKQRELEVKEYIETSIFKEDREEMVTEEDGLFYHATNDYDHQYRTL